jgi:hypothetical protein
MMREVFCPMSRKRLIQNALILLGLFALSGLAGCAAFANYPSDFSILSYHIEVKLAADGSANVAETLRGRIGRDLSSLELAIRRQGTAAVKLQGVSLSCPQDSAGRSLNMIAAARDGKSGHGSPTTYEAAERGDSLRVWLYSSFAAGSERTIRLTYRLEGVVQRHLDAAQLRAVFFSALPRQPALDARLDIRLPGSLSAADPGWTLPVSLAAFSEMAESPDCLSFQAAGLAAGQNMTLVSLLPHAMFGQAPAAGKPLSWEILTAAARAAQAAIQTSQIRSQQAKLQITVLIALAFALLLLIYLFFDREGAADYRSATWQEIPAGLPPAALALFMRKKRTSRLLLGTLLDLVRRGHLALEELSFVRLPEKPGLAGFETRLLDWLFGYLAEGQVLSLAAFRHAAADLKQSSLFRAFCQSFQNELDRILAAKRLLDEPSRRRGRLIGLIAALCYLLLAATGLFVLKMPLTLLLLLPAAALALYSLSFRRFTKAGREVFAAGAALRRAILHGGGQGLIWRPGIERDMLPLAVCLGSADKLLQPGDLELAARLKALESALSTVVLLSGGFRI